MRKYDELTNLLNRGELYNICNDIYQKQNFLNVIYLDINEFIWINSIYGHLEGDNILCELGKLLNKKSIENNGYAFRVGGDEFMLIYPNLNLEDVAQIAKFLFIDFQELKIVYTKDDNKTYSLKLNIDVMQLPKEYFAKNDFSYRRKIHEMIDEKKRNNKQKNGIFVVDNIKKNIHKIF